MIYILIIIFIIYLYIFIKSKPYQTKSKDLDTLKITVIVAAKNEENNLSNLISYLHHQNYSDQNFEVIIVDDNSTDSTLTVGQKLTSMYDNFSLVKAENKFYEGKRGALQIGIDNSRYENIVITDADCEPQPDFLSSYSNKFHSNYDFIFGVAPFRQTNYFANKIACFDNLWVHILTFSFANIGLPYSAAARNFGFKKDSFKKIDGYKNTTDTLSGDDDLLLREAIKHNLRIGTITNKSAFVYSETKTTTSDFLNQKSRHTSTSNYYSSKILLLLGIWHFINLLMLFSIFLVPFFTQLGILFLVKIIGDVLIIKKLMQVYGYSFNIIEILFLQIVYEVLLIINYFKGTFGKKEW